MKFRSIYKYKNINNNSNLLFLVQLLDEMLFHYTIDTYKPSILNTHLLIDEAIKTIQEVENNNIAKSNVKYVLDELVENIKKDDIFLEMLTLPKGQVINVLKNTGDLRYFGKITSTLRMLKSSSDLFIYKNKVEDKLIEVLYKDIDDFTNVRKLSRLYITFLISNRYDPKYLRDVVLDFFWSGDNLFNDISEVKLFFNLFTLKPKEYQVFFAANKNFSLYYEFEGFEFINKHEINELPNEIKINYKFTKISDNQRIYSIKTSAMDPSGARKETERRLRLFSNLVNVFNHKENLEWKNTFMILDIAENKILKVDKFITSMQKCLDLTKPKAKLRLSNFFHTFNLEGDSFNKFINSVSLHSTAIHSESVENQLLNLWVALESLIPEDTKDENISSIEHIISSMLPFLNIVYFSYLLENLMKGLVRWDINIVKSIFKDVDGKDLKSRLVNILTNPDNKEKFNELVLRTKDFHLLSDRLKYFKELLSNKDKLNKSLKSHSKRLDWQIRRIYRARNLIVHTGTRPVYASELIEHIHNYLDIILDSLIKLSSENKIRSVGQGFQYVELIYKDYLDWIKTKDNNSFDNMRIFINPLG